MTKQQAVGVGAVVRTFLIADIRGYSRFSKDRGDSAAAALARRFADLARDAVEARGGNVVELRGDEAFAAFPTAAQAVRAATELQLTCAEEVERDPSLPLLVGIGVDTGPAVPVEDGYRGIAINLAARLCSAAGAGQVLVTSAAAAAAADVPDLVFTLRGASMFKGFEDPVEVVEVAARRTTCWLDAAGTGSVEPLPPELVDAVPLVGRAHQLRWLRGTWRQARRGAGRVVAVSGAQGMGKTRIAAELAAQVQAMGGSVRYAGAGGSALAGALALVHDLTTADAPTLAVVDEVDAIGPELLDAVQAVQAELTERPVLLLLLIRDPAAAPALTAVVEAGYAGDGVRALGPLNPAEVAEVVRLYAGDALAEAPLETIVRASRGVPALVHEAASEWARDEATRRLESAAEFMATVRDRRQSDLEFANNVIGLKLGRIYGDETVSVDPELLAVGPYKGLASFDTQDATWFFGREQLVGELAARLVGSGLLTVVGASGSGKSSVVAAGLVPSLRAGLLPGSQRWRHVWLRPGENPMAALREAVGSAADQPLAAAIAAAPEEERTVVVIDQFEEVFTLCADVDERDEFVAQLTEAAETSVDHLAIVVTLRSDFYGELATYPRFAGMVAANHVLVGPLTRTELQRVVQLPAQRAGVRIETRLVEALVEEAADEPGVLPLLSTALVELWQSRNGGWIRMDAYQRSGGIHGAVARLAEASYDELDDAEQAAARRVLLRLAAGGDGEGVTRRRVPLTEFDLERDVSAARVIERFTADRLLTVSDATVEVAHEALLREWPRLREWLEEDVAGRQLRLHLTEAARTWDAQGRERSDAYRGARLSAALDWSAQHDDELNDLERSFLTGSRTVAEGEAAADRRTNRRLRTLLASTVGVLVVALAAGGLAAVQRQSAQRAARQELARGLGAQAINAPRIDQAVLLARQGVMFEGSDDTNGALLETLLRSPALRATLNEPIEFRPQRLAVAPDDGQLAVLDSGGNVRFFDTATRQPAPTVLHHLGHFRGAMGYAGSDTFVAQEFRADGEPVLRTYDSNSLEREHTLSLSPMSPNQHPSQGFIFADPAGRRLFYAYAVSDPATLLQGFPAYIASWNLKTGSPARTAPLGFGLNAARFTSDGRLIVVTDNAAVELNPATLRPTSRSALHLGPGFGAISPDGHTLAFVSGEPDAPRPQTWELVDLSTRQRSSPRVEQTPGITNLGFVPQSGLVLSTSDDGLVEAWDAGSGALVETFRGHSGGVAGLTLSSDGKTAYTAGVDGTIFAWDLGNDARFGRTTSLRAVGGAGKAFAPPPLAVASDGAEVAVRSSYKTVGLLSLRTLKVTTTLDVGPSDSQSLSWSKQGLLAVGSAFGIATGGHDGGDGEVQLWDVTGAPKVVRTLGGLERNSRPASHPYVAFSADGTELAAATTVGPQTRLGKGYGVVGVWNTATGKLIARRVVPVGGDSLVWSPDGRIVVGDAGGGISVISADGQVERHWSAANNDAVMSLAFLPDGSLLAGGSSGVVREFAFPSGTPIGRPILTEGSPVAAIAAQPAGRQFAVAAGGSGATKLWNDESLTQFGGSFPSSEGTWGNVAYTPDGSQLISTFGDGVISIWPVTLPAWMEHACAVAGRNFTKEEWARFVPGHDYERTCPQYPAA